ncbi:hypothetical protein J5N97_017521 [Dioscorea zingiberensis]|uniref:NAC domain-containing protein n=1 Tax=Dioscorea zingiberensis TaxID=325984 RepID=A0A9D5HG79_9LILI|nr:hypothetical protein J5N97_017521 [Dioscorea zingiberensis]
MSNPELPPGFRFFPTDEELIVHYLRNKAALIPCPASIIGEVDIYKFDPWDLPAKATFGDREWYFFTPRQRKYPNGVRPNRAAASGYWKATGTDKHIVSGRENIGVKKALVFYQGKPPKGQKTNWIMHEYRLFEPMNNFKSKSSSSINLDDWVLCRIYKKNSQPSAMTPVEDQEQEGSSVEDIHASSPRENKQLLTNHLRVVDKSFSLSDILTEADYLTLSQLFDMDQGMPMVQTSLISDQPFIHESTNGSKCNACSLAKLTQTESSVSKGQKSLKRQRPVDCCYPEEGNGHLLTSPKKSSNISYFSNQFYSPQRNLVNHHLLLNQQLGMQ